MQTTEIHPPMIITARLLPGIRIGDAFISIEPLPQRDHEGRIVVRYFIDAPGMEHTDCDLRTGCGEKWDHRKVMGTLLSFLGAAAEAGADGPSSSADA